MTLTNNQLAEFAKKKLGVKSAYMWGDWGRLITNSTINQKVTQYRAMESTKKYYTDKRVAYLRSLVGKGYFGCDCTGLYKWFIWSENDRYTPKYTKATDRDTVGMYNAATVKGDINTIPEIPGLIVYKYGHVGVYIGNGEVVECTLSSFGDGIVKTKLKDRDWTHWLKMPEITYETESAPQQTEFNIGDEVIISGKLYASSNAANPSGVIKNHKTKVTRKILSAKHPYNFTGDIGWMNTEDITAVKSTPKPVDYTMTVNVASLALHNNNKRWIGKGKNSTVIAWMSKGETVTYFPGTETKLGQYTSVKVKYKNLIGYCAKNYLK